MNAPRTLSDEEIEETVGNGSRRSSNRSEVTELIEKLEVKQGLEFGPFADFKEYNNTRSGISMKMRHVSWYIPKSGCVAMRKIEKDGKFYLRVIRLTPQE